MSTYSHTLSGYLLKADRPCEWPLLLINYIYIVTIMYTMVDQMHMDVNYALNIFHMMCCKVGINPEA